MKIIFSRKGFDTGSGGVPSPIFSNGRMLSLPIPSKQSNITYEEIAWNNSHLGKIVSDLTKGDIPPTYRAHLDPDLNRKSLRRHIKWRPLFGQTGSSQGHLKNENICEDDIFIFFGLFRNVINENHRFVYDRNSRPIQVIWGWLQIDQIIDMNHYDKEEMEWALYHPHFHRLNDRNNTVYIAKEFLSLPSLRKKQDGSGCFEYYNKKLQLTNPDSSKLSEWRLPKWIYPNKNRKPLSYHTDMARWSLDENYSYLRTVGRGQEFVLDCSDYPESYSWIMRLISENI